MKGLAKCSLQKLSIAICLILISSLPAIAQQRVNVTGKVTGETGEPVTGASITVAGTRLGTTTRTDGNFTISVPVNGTITVSAIGFTEQVLKVTAQTTSLNVKLLIANNQLDQVVVVGYGTQRKRDVTGSVSSVSETALREVPVSNLQSAL